MRSELRDKVAELLMEAIRHRDRSLLVFWLRAYCQMVEGRDPPAVPFIRLARFVGRHRTELRWCGDLGEGWGRSLVSDSGLFHSGDREQVVIAPRYRKELPLVCARAAAGHCPAIPERASARLRQGGGLLGIPQGATPPELPLGAPRGASASGPPVATPSLLRVP